jgi:hypothetical protein
VWWGQCTNGVEAAQFPSTSIQFSYSIIDLHTQQVRSATVLASFLPVFPIHSTTMATLESLPTEIQHSIFSYLILPFSSYADNSMPRTRSQYNSIKKATEDTKDKRALKKHPYLNLAASSMPLRDTVESFCRSLLIQYFGDQYQNLRDGKTLKKAFRTVWLQKVYKRCLFCRKVSSRRAVFNPLMWCCIKCDNEHFGKRIVRYSTTSTLLCPV